MKKIITSYVVIFITIVIVWVMNFIQEVANKNTRELLVLRIKNECLHDGEFNMQHRFSCLRGILLANIIIFLQPQSYATYQTRGRIKELYHDETALSDYIKAIRLNPYDISIYEDLIIALPTNKESDICRIYKQVLQLHKNYYHNLLLYSSSHLSIAEVDTIVFHSYMGFAQCLSNKSNREKSFQVFNEGVDFCRKKNLTICGSYIQTEWLH